MLSVPRFQPLTTRACIRIGNRELAGVQPPGARRGPGPDRPAAGAAQVPRHLQSNLDEFFMVRVGGLQQKVQASITRGSGADRMPPGRQLEQIGADRPRAGRRPVPLPARRRAAGPGRKGIVIRRRKDLTDDDRKHLRELFRARNLPGPHAAGHRPGHPFPHLLNKSLNLAVTAPPARRPRPALRRRAGARPCCRGSCTLPGPTERYDRRCTPSPRSKTSSGCTWATCSRAWTSAAAVGFRVTRDSEYEIDDERSKTCCGRSRRRSRPAAAGPRRPAGNRGRRPGRRRAVPHQRA